MRSTGKLAAKYRIASTSGATQSPLQQNSYVNSQTSSAPPHAGMARWEGGLMGVMLLDVERYSLYNALFTHVFILNSSGT